MKFETLDPSDAVTEVARLKEIDKTLVVLGSELPEKISIVTLLDKQELATPDSGSFTLVEKADGDKARIEITDNLAKNTRLHNERTLRIIAAQGKTKLTKT
jgi:hypothetical protein